MESEAAPFKSSMPTGWGMGLTAGTKVASGPHTMHTRGFDFECGRDEKRGGYYITG